MFRYAVGCVCMYIWIYQYVGLYGALGVFIRLYAGRKVLFVCVPVYLSNYVPVRGSLYGCVCTQAEAQKHALVYLRVCGCICMFASADLFV